MTTITLGILAYNSAKYIGDLLEQIAPFVEEIVVVDSFSTDDTVAIASHYGAKIYAVEFNGSYAELRNFAIDKATSQYILFMDTDEVLDNPEEFFALDLESDIYSFPRKNYLDEEFQSQWYPDVQHRVIKTASLVQYAGDLHEMPVGKEDAVVLETHIIHKKTRVEQTTNDIRYAEMVK